MSVASIIFLLRPQGAWKMALSGQLARDAADTNSDTTQKPMVAIVELALNKQLTSLNATHLVKSIN